MSFDQQLRCSICPPRQSEFSDISHLLTHVSSKGHLANLHKLQVRSHQELVAAVQVANYNQWYQEHGLGQLLSERMLTKEAKKAAKRDPSGATKRDDRAVKDETFIAANPDESSPSRHVTRNRARNKAKRTKHLQAVNEDDGDLDYSPIQGLRSGILPPAYSTIADFDITDVRNDCRISSLPSSRHHCLAPHLQQSMVPLIPPLSLRVQTQSSRERCGRA